MLYSGIKYLLYVVIFWLLPKVGFTQYQKQKLIDSLIPLIEKSASDTIKINLINQVAFNYFSVSPELGMAYANKALTNSTTIKYKKGISEAYNAIGANHWAKNEFNIARDYYGLALKIAEDLGDKKLISHNLLDIGDAYESQSNYSRALEYFFKAQKINLEIGDKFAVLGCYGNIAGVYELLNEYDKALEFFHKSLLLATESANQRNITYFNKRIGKVFAKKGNYPIALNYTEKAKQIFVALKDQEDLATTLGDIAEIHSQNKDWINSIKYYQEALSALSILKTDNAQVYISSYYSDLGKVYLEWAKKNLANKEGLLNNSSNYLNKSIKIALQRNDLSQSYINFNLLSEVREKQNNFQEALALYKKATVFKDSLYNSERMKENTRQELEFEYDKKKDSLNFISILQENKFKQAQALSKNDFRQKLLYVILSFLIIILIIAIFLNKSRIKRLNLAYELNQQKSLQLTKDLEMSSRLNEWKITALKAQMNPHFIFNCLNSIMLYTEQKNTAAATEYLHRFSKLIRYLLENAQKESNTLQSEVEAIQLYLEMESMRYKGKLKYAITIDPEIDAEMVSIPQMIIQPYVENAIWHGIMYKDEGGNIDIIISKPSTEAYLQVSIIDNGVGRQISAEKRAKNLLHKKSLGMNLTSERIDILKEKYAVNASIDVIDLNDDHKKPIGTKIIIKLPII